MEEKLEITLDKLFLSSQYPLEEVAFFFGAGSSKDAGYPLTSELTSSVLSGLSPAELSIISDAVDGQPIDCNRGVPDIEYINDCLMRRKVEAPSDDLIELESRIKIATIKVLTDVLSVNYHHHQELFRYISSRTRKGGITWMFTTNYDLVLEHSAALVGMRLENGFSGSSTRFFNTEEFSIARGTLQKTFVQSKKTTVNLIKLHGSLDWWCSKDKFYQSGYSGEEEKSLILPNRKKILETMERPYSDLFRVAKDALGFRCKYLIVCGHSFRDEHINDVLFKPKLRESSINILALFDFVPDGLDDLLRFNNFHYISSTTARISGKEYSCETDIWRFEKLVNFLKNSTSGSST